MVPKPKPVYSGTIYLMRLVSLGSLTLVALVACGDADTTSLFVDVRTDFVGGRDFTGVQVSIGEGDIRERHEHNYSGLVDYFRGARVATASSIEAGATMLEVVLVREGRPVITRIVRATVVADVRNIVTVVITRDCSGVMCPSDAGNPLFDACLGGRCEDPRCTPEAPAFCAAGECTRDDECSATGCQQAQCVSNVCLLGADDAQCDAGFVCDVNEGCVAADFDAGRNDASIDARSSDVTEPSDADVDTSAGADAGTDSGADGGVDANSGDAGPTVVVIDGDSYDVAPGYVLDSPFVLTVMERDAIVGRVAAMALPNAASTFPDGLYIGVDGDSRNGPAPFVARLDDAGFQLLTSTNGNTGPDENMSAFAFSPPGGPYGDFLYVCSASPGGGDGIYRVNSAGTFERFRVFNNCNGMAFDPASVLGDFGIDGPLYANVGGLNFDRYSPDSSVATLFAGLDIVGPYGYAVHIPQGGAFAGSLFLSNARLATDLEDAILVRVDSVEPFLNELPWLSDLPDPGSNGVVFASGGALGDGFFLNAIGLGELRRYDAAGDFVTLVTGLSQPSALATDGDVLYIADNDRGRVLRLRVP